MDDSYYLDLKEFRFCEWDLKKMEKENPMEEREFVEKELSNLLERTFNLESELYSVSE